MVKKVIRKIFVDTNAWMAVGQYHVPLFQELERLFGSSIEIFVLEGTISELQKLSETLRGKDKLAAKLVLQIIAQKVQTKEITVSPITGYVDDLLVNESKAGALVITADFVLQKRLKRPYVIIKKNKFLEIRE